MTPTEMGQSIQRGPTYPRLSEPVPTPAPVSAGTLELSLAPVTPHPNGDGPSKLTDNAGNAAALAGTLRTLDRQDRRIQAHISATIKRMARANDTSRRLSEDLEELDRQLVELRTTRDDNLRNIDAQENRWEGQGMPGYTRKGLGSRVVVSEKKLHHALARVASLTREVERLTHEIERQEQLNRSKDDFVMWRIHLGRRRHKLEMLVHVQEARLADHAGQVARWKLAFPGEAVPQTEAPERHAGRTPGCLTRAARGLLDSLRALQVGLFPPLIPGAPAAAGSHERRTQILNRAFFLARAIRRHETPDEMRATRMPWKAEFNLLVHEWHRDFHGDLGAIVGLLKPEESDHLPAFFAWRPEAPVIRRHGHAEIHEGARTSAPADPEGPGASHFNLVFGVDENVLSYLDPRSAANFQGVSRQARKIVGRDRSAELKILAARYADLHRKMVALGGDFARATAGMSFERAGARRREFLDEKERIQGRMDALNPEMDWVVVHQLQSGFVCSNTEIEAHCAAALKAMAPHDAKRALNLVMMESHRAELRLEVALAMDAGLPLHLPPNMEMPD